MHLIMLNKYEHDKYIVRKKTSSGIKDQPVNIISRHENNR